MESLSCQRRRSRHQSGTPVKGKETTMAVIHPEDRAIGYAPSERSTEHKLHPAIGLAVGFVNFQGGRGQLPGEVEDGAHPGIQRGDAVIHHHHFAELGIP